MTGRMKTTNNLGNRVIQSEDFSFRLLEACSTVFWMLGRDFRFRARKIFHLTRRSKESDEHLFLTMTLANGCSERVRIFQPLLDGLRNSST